MTNCSLCGKSICAKEMEKDVLGPALAGLPRFENVRFMPNIVQGLAMQCNRCGIWICSRCAKKTALDAGAGMIKHSDCGGMFETPK